MFAMKSVNICNDQVNYDQAIASLKTYVLNIPIHRIFEKDIELFGKNNNI